jgi:hypothetical protein
MLDKQYLASLLGYNYFVKRREHKSKIVIE